MDICKGPEKLSVYQPSFMIDDLLTRKAIDQNGGGDYSTSIPLDSVVGRRRENGDTLHSNGRVAVDRVSFIILTELKELLIQHHISYILTERVMYFQN